MSIETLPALLALRAEDSPGVDAVVDHDQRVGYAELDTRSRERAAWLVARGVNKGHRVGLLMENGCEWALNACAAMRIGATLVPLSTLLKPPELAAQLALAGVRQLVATPAFHGRDYRAELADLDRAALPSLAAVYFSDELGDGGTPDRFAVTDALADSVRPGDDMVVIFTSGSGGTPRGVIHTHGGALRANAAGLEARCIRRGERLYLPMPLFWAGGFAGGLVSALNAGATLLTEAIAEPAQTLGFLQREQVTLFRGWPDQAAQIALHPDFHPRQLETLKPGSLPALLPASPHGERTRQASLFGMTETFGPCCGYAMDTGMPADKAGSCGKPFAGIELRIVDPDSGEPLPAGKTGCLQLRGRNLFRGICGREREDTFTADGWFASGDLGRLDEDGFFYFAGRGDDMIKLRGVSVFPAEIANALESLASVQRAFVTGLELEGQLHVGAAILPEPGAYCVPLELERELATRLTSFKVPSRWHVLSSLEELPRTPTGKVDRPALCALLLGSA